jgi:glycosyltransferase involved in cell wall biosynthesis
VISVIVTTYERRALLARTLASVFAQTTADHEVIVVDDGSTDGTAEFLDSQPVSAVTIPHSGNPAVARNAGLARARGELITFVDSDDTWEPTALQDLARALADHPEAGFAYCDYSLQFPGALRGVQLGRRELAMVGDIFEPLLESDFLVTGGVLMRRTVVSAVGPYDPACAPAEDWDYWLRLAALAQGAFVPRALIRIDSAADSLSRAPGGAIYAANCRVTRKALTWCRANRAASVPMARRAHRRSLLARYAWNRRVIARTTRDLVMAVVGR